MTWTAAALASAPASVESRSAEKAERRIAAAYLTACEHAAADLSGPIMHHSNRELRPHGVAHDMRGFDVETSENGQSVGRHDAIVIVFRHVRLSGFPVPAAIQSDHLMSGLDENIKPTSVSPGYTATGAKAVDQENGRPFAHAFTGNIDSA